MTGMAYREVTLSQIDYDQFLFDVGHLVPLGDLLLSATTSFTRHVTKDRCGTPPIAGAVRQRCYFPIEIHPDLLLRTSSQLLLYREMAKSKGVSVVQIFPAKNIFCDLLTP
jgi:hypothetical protein